MIWFFTPYAYDRKLFNAWDQLMDLVQDPQDWVCMMDGDIAFFRNDFGHHIEMYTKKYPHVSIFSCYASRSGTPWMMPANNQFENRNIIVHRQLAEDCATKHTIELEVLDKRVTGHLMVMQKQTWITYRENIKTASESRDLYGIDTIICKQVLAGGGSISLMKGIYVFHYYRHMEGAHNKSHLL